MTALNFGKFRNLLQVSTRWLSPQMRCCSSATSSKYILVETQGKKGNVGLITLNRPEALNALSDPLLLELQSALENFQNDPKIGCIVITGSQKAFAAGADIKEMKDMTFSEIYTKRTAKHRTCVADFSKPIIAAVNGYAFGGGCELAMCCDIIYAGEKAKFGQPEINLGIIPGGGGTQRLIRSVGKSKAMEMCLSGKPITAQEAEKSGLVSKVFPVEQVVTEAIKTGEIISYKSTIATQICKEALSTAYETTLREGLHFEKKFFISTFATDDQKEGMTAFVEKREPLFKGR